VRAGGVPGAFHKFALRQTILTFKPFWSNPKGKKPTGTKYGSASSRSASQKAHALTDAHSFVNAIPVDAARIFTDGSSLGNPGPAGAGALVVSPRSPGTADFCRLHCSLCTPGEGRSNNFAELWAIGMAISFLLDTWPILFRPAVYILSDSKFITDLLNRASFSVEFEVLVAQVLALKDAYSANHRAILFCWVPGHVGLAGNEAADALANVGSGTARTLPLTIPSSRNERFEYQVSPDNSPP
jgi:ribonuclease HI